jgi:hypothetical protein
MVATRPHCFTGRSASHAASIPGVSAGRGHFPAKL